MSGARRVSLDSFLERVRGPRTTVTFYGVDPDDDLRAFFEQFDVTVTTEALPVAESEGYLTVRRGEQFRGSLGADRFGDLVDPPTGKPWSAPDRDSAFREAVEMLDGTPFRATDRETLLAVSRELEDRAWRTGRGRLHAGFQSLSAFRAQVPVYRQLAVETAVSVTVYGRPDWVPAEPTGVTVRGEPAEELGRFWFLAFESGDRAGALVAEEVEPDAYGGVWTDDPGVTRDLLAYLEGRYDREHNG